MSPKEVVLGIISSNPPLQWQSLKSLAQRAGLSSRETNNALAALLANGAVVKGQKTVNVFLVPKPWRTP